MSSSKKRASESQAKGRSTAEEFVSNFKATLNSFQGNDRKTLLQQLKDVIDSEIENDDLSARTEQFKEDMADSMKPENFFGGENDEGKVPAVLIELAKNLKCTDYSIEHADYHCSSNITVDFDLFTVSRGYNGANDGTGSIDHTVSAEKGGFKVTNDSYFTDTDLTKIFGAITSKLPGVTIEHFRTFIGSVFSEDYEF